MDDRLNVARRVLAQAQLRTGMRVVESWPVSENNELFAQTARKAFTVPDSLRNVFPYGIPKAEVINVRGSGAAAALIAGIASQQGAWVALLGASDVGWDFLLKSGVETERFVYVPAVESLTSHVLFAAIDGFDVVLLEGMRFRAREEMLITKRARLKNTLVVSDSWNGDLFRFHCAVQGIGGISRGRGHIREVAYQFTSKYGTAYLNFGMHGWNFNNAGITRKQHSPDAEEVLDTVIPKLAVVK
ncbi:hypothetical protein [Arcanobacterium bovis]|uniref:Uncharacterized protein n=1 Tax=Arcanobacterium bovis TaxID=2529275 RepID=A0A4Q9V1M5_9ACTO|nr:hypothetical protein [Arcanobacterium bovis]TBW22991.1 hypothetical protein EZJ44_03645 [Arcanobacterium bovis]